VRTLRSNSHSYNFLCHFFPNPSGSLIPRVQLIIIIIIIIIRSFNGHMSVQHHTCRRLLICATSNFWQTHIKTLTVTSRQRQTILDTWASKALVGDMKGIHLSEVYSRIILSCVYIHSSRRQNIPKQTDRQTNTTTNTLSTSL